MVYAGTQGQNVWKGTRARRAAYSAARQSSPRTKGADARRRSRGTERDGSAAAGSDDTDRAAEGADTDELTVMTSLTQPYGRGDGHGVSHAASAAIRGKAVHATEENT